MTGRFPLLSAAFLVVFGAISTAQSNSAFTTLETGVFIRDLAVDPVHQCVYGAAQYDNQVRVMGFDLGEPVARIEVGQAPVALALADDARTLACVNRLDNTLSLIDVDAQAVRATVKLGESPVAVAALPGGDFVTVDSFSDSLSVVTGADSSPLVESVGTVGVPGSIAVGDGLVAVGGRVPPSVRIHALPSWKTTANIPLPEPPVALAWVGKNLAIAMPSGLRLCTPGGRVLHERKTAVRDIVVSEGQLYALTGSAVLALDDSLTTLSESALPEPASHFIAEDSFQAALTAGEPRLLVRDGKAGQRTSGPRESASVVLVTEAEDISKSEGETVAEPVPATPARVAPHEENEPVAAPAQTPPETAGENETRPSPAQVSPVRRHSTVRKNPIKTQGVRAPSPHRPSASPLRGMSKQSITDAITRPSELLSTESGFQPPDPDKLGNLKADKSYTISAEGKLRYEGNVRLRLGDTQATMDLLDVWNETKVVHGEGAVALEQGESTLHMDAFTYYPEKESQPEAAAMFAAPADDGRLRMGGKLEAYGVDLREPTRELTADEIVYDFSDKTGKVTNAKGRAGIYFFAAEDIQLLGAKSFEAKDVWVTTCDHDPPHYKLRLSHASVMDGAIQGGTNARLQLWNLDTPFWLPKWRRGSTAGTPWNIDFDSGRRAVIGYYLNVGQQFEVSPSLSLGPRLFITENEGVGLGGDVYYDYMNRPASWLFRTKGEAHGFYTTEDRGYLHLYHRYEYSNDLIVRAQVEQWSEEDFYKDFFFDEYTNRAAPRTFVNATLRRDSYVATGTVRLNTHHWINETERLPEASFHLLERPILDRLLLSFDTVDGYNSREPRGSNGARTTNVARLTLDWDPLPALAVTPFWEVEGTWYSEDRSTGNDRGRLTTNLGATAQTRLHKVYNGAWGFSAFKHLVLPSVTYSFRPNTSIDPYDTPRYDSLDNVYGRSRIELKLDNVFYGRDEETEEVWQVGRITLYQGNDFSSEYIDSEDYELEFDLRPRPWWGMQVAGERHSATNESDTIRERPYRQLYFDLYERVVGREHPRAQDFELNDVFGDYNRILAQLYYDDNVLGGGLNGRIGFAYTETQNEVYNREMLYGIGFELGEHWGLGFEHIYDFEQGELREQTYELRRSLHCWETALRFRDRQSGFDVDIEFNIKAFPGSKLKF